jgi:PAS domain S-box-containing protein
MPEKPDISNPPLNPISENPPDRDDREVADGPVGVVPPKNDLAAFLVESVPMYAVVIGMDGGILAINYPLLQTLGYRKEELLNERFVQTLVYGPDRLKAASFRNKDWTTRQLKTEIHLQARDGRVLLVLWHSKIIHDAVQNREFFFCTGIDISEQLQEKDTQYRLVFEATTDGIVIVDLETRRVVEVNPAFVNMHGYTLAEFRGMDPATFVHPDYHGMLENYLETVKQGKLFRGRAMNIRKDGTPFYIEVYGTPFVYQGKVHGLSVNRDITEMVEAYRNLEQRVEERTRELSTLLEINRTVGSTLELKPLLNLILEQLKVVTDYSGAGIVVCEGDDISFLEARQPDPQPPVPLTSVHLQLGPNAPLWERFMHGIQIIIPDVRADTEEGRGYRQFVGEKLESHFGYVRSWMGTPMQHKGKVLGILSVSHNTPDYYTARHAALTRAIADQAATAIENARLYEQALAVAALEERQRLARELHDSVSQALFGILVGTNSARILADRDPSRLPQSLDYIGNLAQSGMAEMRALLFELRPESLENEGLVAALSKQAAAIKARYALEMQVTTGAEPPVPLNVKEALYRIAQEAMQNTVKHAQASAISLSLLTENGKLILTVRDNGHGFDPKGSFPGHLGLKSMQERAGRLGAIYSVASRPGEGTTVRVEYPLTGPD